jgi:hypothetical protein
MNRTSATVFSFSLATVAALGTVSAGCGSLDTDTTASPEVAALGGKLVNPSSVSVSGAVRVAVVWAGANGSFDVSEDLPVQPVFPASFAVSLDAGPPASALMASSAIAGSSGDYQVAIGSVVAYDDLNGNGKLDLVPADASSYVDKIVATDETLDVIYLAGGLPTNANAADAGGTPVLGYNLFRDCPDTSSGSSGPGSICPSGSGSGGAAAACGWEPVTTAITLTVATDPQVDSLMCQSQSGTATATGTGMNVPGRPATYPSPCDPDLSCSDDGSSYTYETSCTTTSTGICAGNDTSCELDVYTRPSPVPSGWPCKAE